MKAALCAQPLKNPHRRWVRRNQFSSLFWGLFAATVTHPYHARSEQRVVVEQHPSSYYLLEPLLAGFSAALFILPVVVVSIIESTQQLLGESANSSHQSLAEDCISSQLQICVWEKEEWNTGIRRPDRSCCPFNSLGWTCTGQLAALLCAQSSNKNNTLNCYRNVKCSCIYYHPITHKNSE